MSFWKKLFGNEPEPPPLPEADPPPGVHAFNPKGTCRICGCSRAAINSFGWECRGGNTSKRIYSRPLSQRPSAQTGIKRVAPIAGVAAAAAIWQRNHMIEQNREIQAELNELNENLSNDVSDYDF